MAHHVSCRKISPPFYISISSSLCHISYQFFLPPPSSSASCTVALRALDGLVPNLLGAKTSERYGPAHQKTTLNLQRIAAPKSPLLDKLSGPNPGLLDHSLRFLSHRLKFSPKGQKGENCSSCRARGKETWKDLGSSSALGRRQRDILVKENASGR